MLDRQFTSETEINKVYADHLESLLTSGLPFDEQSLRAEWAEAVSNFHEGNSTPPWADSTISL